MAGRLARIYLALDRHHLAPVRYGLAAGGWMLALLLSGRPFLAGIVAKHFADNHAKTALRFLAWIFKYGWPKRQVALDPLFDITLYLDDSSLQKLGTFIDVWRGVVAPWEAATDRLYVLSRLAHAALLSGRQEAYADLYAAYLVEARLAFDEVPHISIGTKRLGDQVTAEERHLPAEDARRALKAFEDLAGRVGLPWFAVSGTFLGIVRERAFLAHDYDLDLGYTDGALDFETIVDAARVHPEFRIRQVDYQNRFVDTAEGQRLERVPACLKLSHVNGVPVDLFVHHIDDGVCWHGSAINRWNNSPFDLADYEIAGMSVQGPADFDTYLSENYGAWRIPVRDFVSTDGSGTPNLVMVRNLFTVAIFLKRMVSASSGHKRRLFDRLEEAGAVIRTADGYQFNPEFGIVGSKGSQLHVAKERCPA